jgi:hypothetical protein
MKYRYRYADIFSNGNSSLHAASRHDYTRHYICILYKAVITQNYITKDCAFRTAMNIRKKEFVGSMKYGYRYADIFSHGNSSLHATSGKDYTRHYI